MCQGRHVCCCRASHIQALSGQCRGCRQCLQNDHGCELAQGLSPASCHAGDGATNVIPDTVEVGGSLRGLSELTFYHLIDRATEVSTKPSALNTAMLLVLSAALHCMSGMCIMLAFHSRKNVWRVCEL